MTWVLLIFAGCHNALSTQRRRGPAAQRGHAPTAGRSPALDPAVLRCGAGQRAPKNPAHYDYRRAALDALHFVKLCGRSWNHLRGCAGYNVQYFSVIEAQKRGAPHLHAAVRGAIPRAILKQVVAAADLALWWPPFDQVRYDNDRLPVWAG